MRIRIALRKSTVRPWPSVSRPSSSTWSSTSKTSGCAFSTSSSRTTRVRAPAHRLGQLPALLVADVAGRGADQARDRVLLAVLAHVDPDHGVLVVEEEVGQRLGELGLADAGGAEEEERAGRAVRVGDARAAAPHGVGDGLHGGRLADQPAAQLLLHPQQLGALALEQPAGRDAGPGGDHVGHVVRADLLLDHRLGGVLVGGALLGLRQLGFGGRDLRVHQLGGALELAVALGTFRPRCAGRRGAP